jgi:hypothetical protein
MDAFIDQLASQSNVLGAKQMASMARRVLTVHEPGFSAIVIPCDQQLHRALPDADMLERISSAMADSYQVNRTVIPAKWTHSVLGEVALCAVVFHPKSSPPPSHHEVLEPIEDSLQRYVGRGRFVYGSDESYGILDVIVNSFVGAAAGTVSSLMVQDLYHAAGGERRLARLVRRYKRAGPGTNRARRLIEKIKRTAERLKGRTVDWNEIEGLLAQYDAQQGGL